VEQHVLDYTFSSDSQDIAVVKETLESHGLDSLFSELFEMRVGYIRSAKDTDNAFEMNSVLEYLARLREAMTGMFFSIILDIRHIPM